MRHKRPLNGGRFLVGRRDQAPTVQVSFDIGIGDVAADEVPAELRGGGHDDEAAGGWVDDEVAGIRDGADQASDEADRFCMRVRLAVDLLRPAVADAVIAPGALGGERRLLQHEQIIAAAPRAIAVAEPEIVPGDEVDALELGDALVVGLAQVEGIGPAQQVAARCQNARRFAATGVDIGAGHGREVEAAFLAGALVAVFELVEHTPILRVEEHERRAAVRQ